MNRLRLAVAVAALSLTSGCLRLLPEPPPAPLIYPLPPAQIAPAAAPAPLVIGVARPNAPQAIAGLDIVWERDGVIGYTPRAVWTARAPEALQTLLVNTIDAQDLVSSAVRLGEGPRSDYDLRSELRAFQIVEDASGRRARLSVDAKLVEARTRTVVAATSIVREAPVERRSESLAVARLQSVAAEGAVDIGRWAAEAARVHREAQSTPPPAAIEPQSSAASSSR